MLVFSTRLPLRDDTTQEDCLNLFIKWVTDSPNYDIEIINYDVSSHKDYDCSFGNQTFSIRHFKDDNVEISACRLENRSEDAVWINDCIFLCENGTKSLLIQLNCNRTSYSTEMPKPHKPYIIRQFVESGYCKDDGGIPVTDTVIEADADYYSTCVDIMNGDLTYSMPVVYVSCGYGGNSVVNTAYLARQLSGVAHVFAEKSRDTALRLRKDTDGNNAHSGYVGVYFPGTRLSQKHGLSDYPNHKVMTQAIIDSVWKALVNRLDSQKFNWNHILAMQARQKMAEWQDISNQDKAQLSEFMDTFDLENRDLREQIDELNTEVYSLRAQLDTLREALNGGTGDRCFFRAGSEPELYAGERSDLIRSILLQVQSKYKESSRPYALITSMLEANPETGECERVITGVSEIFGGDGRLTKTTKAQLKDLGFAIEEDGPHYKIIFHDSKYIFTVSKTPSDHRTGKNLISEIRAMLDVNRKI